MTNKKTEGATWEGLLQLFLEGFDIPSIADIRHLKQRVDRLEAMVEAMAGTDIDRPFSPAPGVPPRKQAARTAEDGETPGREPEVRPERKRRTSAGEIVLKIISDHPRGTNFKTIRAATDYDDKKLRNIIFRLDKTGKIKRVKRGIYKKA